LAIYTPTKVYNSETVLHYYELMFKFPTNYWANTDIKYNKLKTKKSQAVY